MPRLIEGPTIVESAGNLPKVIREFVGRVNSGEKEVSIALMNSPAGWVEPGQRPSFREITLVLSGILRVESEDGTFDVGAGQAIIAEPGEWIRYSSPHAPGAEYVAICLPSFSPETVNRDTD